jgi:hypothetical protein
MKPRILVAAILLASAVLANATEWIVNPATGNRYGLTSGPVTWHEAEAGAVAVGGHLASITSQAESDWVLSTFGYQASFWIGLTDQAQEGIWQWTSGEPLDFANWSPGEPNNMIEEDWGVINWGFWTGEPQYAGKWNDLESGADYPSVNPVSFKNDSGDWGPILGIMEVPSSVPDAGSTLLLLAVGLAPLARVFRRS